MGLNTKQLYGAAAKGDLLYFEPEQLVIVDDTSHPLADERIAFPIDEAMVRNIMHHGVLEPIIVRKNGDAIEVIDGRQRVVNCREANRRLVAQGLQSHRVTAITKRGDAHQMMGMMISANELRRDDTLLVKAKKAQRYLDHGRSIEETANVFGRDVQTVKGWLALLETPQEVQDAVAKGEIPASAAKKLAKLPAEKRKAAIAKKASTKGKRARAKKSTERDVRALVKRLRDLDHAESSFTADILEYAFGLADRKAFEKAHPEFFR